MKHKHHIIPRHAGGTDDPSNIVYLSIKEHAKAHKNLYEKYGRWQDKLAYEGLSGQIDKEKIIEEIYKNRKTRLGKNHYGDMSRFSNWKGKKLSEKHIENIRKARLGTKQPQTQKDKVAKALSKEYIIEYKDKTHQVQNLRDFARQNNLDQGNLTKVAQGKLKQHKGYKVRYK